MHTGRDELDANVTAFAATNVIGDSSDEAYREAERWLAEGAPAGSSGLGDRATVDRA